MAANTCTVTATTGTSRLPPSGLIHYAHSQFVATVASPYYVDGRDVPARYLWTVGTVKPT